MTGGGPREHSRDGEWLPGLTDDEDAMWREGYDVGYEDGAADVWASLHDDEGNRNDD